MVMFCSSGLFWLVLWWFFPSGFWFWSSGGPSGGLFLLDFCFCSLFVFLVVLFWLFVSGISLCKLLMKILLYSLFVYIQD